MMHVWHDKNPRFGFNDLERVFPDDFEHVAEVDVLSLDDAYELTNHIEQPWHKAKIFEVTALVPEPRSTSPGDIVVDEHGNVHICLMLGWKNLGVAEKIVLEPFYLQKLLMEKQK